MSDKAAGNGSPDASSSPSTPAEPLPSEAPLAAVDPADEPAAKGAEVSGSTAEASEEPEASEATEPLIEATETAIEAAETTSETAAEEPASEIAEPAPETAAEEQDARAAEPVPEATEEEPAVESAEPVTEATAEEPAAEATTDATAEEKSALPEPVSPTEQRFRDAKKQHLTLEGKVIGWNKGGLHVVIDDVTAFCPRSEIELAEAQDPAGYLDQSLEFKVLKIQDKGRRIVVSRAAALRSQRSKSIRTLKKKLEVGAVLEGTVASLTDFGAFIDLGGLKGLLHVSEISHDQVRLPEDVLEVGQEVEVKVIRLEGSGKRISLSMKALGPDPWQGVADRYTEGTLVTGKVENTSRVGAFIQLEPGLTGLLPTSEMNLPRDASSARVYPRGREVKIQVVSVDRRRRRISLALEGANVEGSRSDFKAYKTSHADSGFHPFAEALKKLRQ